LTISTGAVADGQVLIRLAEIAGEIGPPTLRHHEMALQRGCAGGSGRFRPRAGQGSRRAGRGRRPSEWRL